MAEVADLFATLGLRVDQAAWARGDARVAGLKRAVETIAPIGQRAGNGLKLIGAGAEDAGRRASGLGSIFASLGRRAQEASSGFGGMFGAIGAYFGARAAYGALIKFNSTVEDSKNQIAGMLAISKNTHLSAELANADMLMANLQRRAAALPGTTAEYVAMLGNITRPIMDAKLSMKDLEDITVNSVVAAKAFGIDAGVAARDIDQALRGMFHSVDPFSGKVLGALGYKGEEGRSRFNALSEQKRAAEFKRGLLTPQIAELAAAQGKTFSGVLATLQDAMQQFFAKVGKPLFEGLVEAIKSVNAWLDANQEKLQELAATVGQQLLEGFKALSSAFLFLMQNLNTIVPILKVLALGFIAVKVAAAAAWIAALGPLGLILAAIGAIVYAVIHWREEIGAALESMAAGAVRMWEDLRAVGKRIWKFFVEDIPNALISAFKAAFEFIADLPIVKQVIAAIRWIQNRESGAAEKSVLEDIDRMGDRSINMQTGELMLPAPTTGRQVNVGGVTVGDIHVSSPNADPAAVAMEVHRAFDERFDAKLRQTLDEVG